MAFLDIVNVPRMLGADLHCFRRANVWDKVDLGLAGVLALVGSIVFLMTGFSSPLVCVPMGCTSSGTSTNCALDWSYQSGVCKAEAQSLPAANFHYLLLGLASLMLALLTVPIYWGTSVSKELFDNFYYIWAKLKNGDEECKDVEWKRRMHFVLDQLKSGKALTTRYAVYHGLALLVDTIALALVGLYTLNFMNIDPLGLGTDGVCALGTFSCTNPNKILFSWFGVLSCLIISVKIAVNLKCLLFCLGMPGLFGRNFLIYADQLRDNSGEKLFQIQTNPCLVLVNSILVLLKALFVSPCQWSVAFCKFYARNFDADQQELLKRPAASNIKAELKEAKKVEKEVKSAADYDNAGDGKKGADAAVDVKKDKPKDVDKAKDEDKSKADESVSTPLYVKPAQNWSDFFFIIDSLSFNIDMCDLVLFMTKIAPVPGLENKKVSVDSSYLDTSSNTLIVATTDAGVIENILDSELSTSGGLQIVGWLEGPTGIVTTVRTRDNPKHLAFAVSLGSTYELVTAVYARGRMLARLQNFTFQCPQDTKKQMKKYGQNIPLSAFISQSLFQKFSSDQGSQMN